MSWKLVVEDNIGILELDTPNTEVNVLTSEILLELKSHLDEIKTNEEIKALLFTSAKKRIFIAGADINEIHGITSPSDAFEKAEKGKEVFQAIEDLKIPTFSVINGACLGGGCELSLACNYILSSFSPNVKIGLPEVNLGILPGFGGSIRLPRRIGLLKSLPLILSGKMLSGKEALKAGIAYRLFPEQTLLDETKALAKEAIRKGQLKTRPAKKTALTWFLQETTFGRSLVFDRARKDVLKKTKGFYPAPIEIIDLIEKTISDSSESAYRLESDHFAKLGSTEVAKNLITLFFLNEKYKKFKWVESSEKPKRISKTAVIGAGVMGGGIAQRISYKDIPVRVKDINHEALGGALKEAYGIYKGALKRRRLSKYQVENKMGLITVGLDYSGFKSAELIIEAVVENMEIKKKVFAELDQVADPNAVLASNTSSLSVSEMAEATKRPERVAGLHFFNPVHRMPLVEVIRGEKTSDETLGTLIQFARDLGKTVIVTKDRPGFLVNRLLLPYMNEAAYLLEEGVAPEKVDEVATKFGMPMGPIELADQVGVDVGYKVALILEEAFGERMKVAEILKKVYDKGFLGKKVGKGFYVYKGKSKTVNDALPLKKRNSNLSDEDILKRMIYIMINEAARCLDEGVIDSPGAVDVGMIFGTGFPPFRAGLLHYADTIGLNNVLNDLVKYQNSVSDSRFAPCAYLEKLGSASKKFYDN